MRRYEVVYISFDDLSEDEFENQLERYTSIVSKMDGKVIKIEKWGKRRLAYPIQKRKDGVYVLIDFAGDNRIVSELERNFRIDDKVMRFISVKTHDKVELEEIEKEIAKAQEAEQAKETAVEKPGEAAVAEGPEGEEETASEEVKPQEEISEEKQEAEETEAEETEAEEALPQPSEESTSEPLDESEGEEK
ncbi:MAG: 30S ribosomal protein S6 [Syntrophales bacterium]|nr:30S ribosomal protein S6 [Syntrophales bacterium]MDY0044845.1 30S ribosomal protein S6 [Syntrophales bacterium]